MSRTNDLYRLAYQNVAPITEAERAYAVARRKSVEAWNHWAKHHMIVHRRQQPTWNIPDVEVEAKRREINQKFSLDTLHDNIDLAKRAKEKRLMELAPRVVVCPGGDQVTVASSKPEDYREQTNTHNHAEAALEPLRAKLVDAGCNARVYFHEHSRTMVNRSLARLGEYRLVSNCPVWMADAVRRTITQGDWEIACARFGVALHLYYQPETTVAKSIASDAPVTPVTPKADKLDRSPISRSVVVKEIVVVTKEILFDAEFVRYMREYLDRTNFNVCDTHAREVRKWSAVPITPIVDREFMLGMYRFTVVKHTCDICAHIKSDYVTCCCCAAESMSSAHETRLSGGWIVLPTLPRLAMCNPCQLLTHFEQYCRFHHRLKDKHGYDFIHLAWADVIARLRKGRVPDGQAVSS